MDGPEMDGPDMDGPDMDESPGRGPAVDVLASEPLAPERRAKWSVVGAVVAAVAVVIGGVAYGAASLSGGGSQPADALPSGVVAFTQVDLDPPAGQKVDGFRFLRKFPSLHDRLAGDDLRKVIFESVADNAGWKDVDFESEVAPWLGQRVGMGVYPASTFSPGAGSDAKSSPAVVVALQVTDEGAARRGLDRLLADVKDTDLTDADLKGTDRPGYVLADGYALLAKSQRVATAAGDLVSRGSLAASSTFVADTADLGDGFASAWFDGRAVGELLPAASALGLGRLGLGGLDASALDKSSLRMAYVLRFDGPDVVELAGHVTGGPTVPGGDVRLTGLLDLPASSAVAVGIGGGAALVDPLWTSIRKQAAATKGASADDLVAEAERASGLDLPDDLKVLLGSNLVLGLDRAGLRGGKPELGARVVTSEPARADALLDKLLTKAGVVSGVPPVVHRATDDGYVLASTQAQAARLTDTATGDRLGDVSAFRSALPDVDGARFAAWVDLREVLAAFAGQRDGGLPKDLRPLQGAGMTATSDGKGAGSFRLRLVTH